MKDQKTLISSKKATYAADTAPFYMVFAVVVTMMFLAFVFIVSSNSSSKVQVPEGLDEYLIYQRFLRSPDCFVYEDISGRAYPLIIDISEFNQNNLNRCYEAKGDIPAFRLVLSFNGTEKILHTSNWDELAGIKKREKPKDIIVYDDNVHHMGKMTIEMQNV